MVISDLVPRFRAIADLEAFGPVLWRPGATAMIAIRHRVGVAAHHLPIDELPPMLAPSAPRATTVLSIPGPFDPAHPFVKRLADYGIDTLLVIPVPGDGGFWWGGLRGATFSSTQIAQFEACVAEVAAAAAAQARQGAAREIRFARLEAIDRIDAMLPVIADTLDIRAIFHRLSEVTRSALPHDAATVQLLDSEHQKARIYAIDGITGNETDEPFSTDYAP